MPRLLRRPGLPRPIGVLAAVAAAAAVVLPGYSPTGVPGSAAAPGPVVVLGTSGLHWDDLDPGLSTIATLVANGAGASSLARRGDPRCPLDGWLTLSALMPTQTIDRTATDGACRPMPTVTVGADRHGAIDGWATMIDDETNRGAVPGLLVNRLADRRSVAVGTGAILALAVDIPAGLGADGDHQTANAWPGVPSDAAGGIDPSQTADELAQQVQEAVDTHPALLVVDLGGLNGSTGSTGNVDATPTADATATADASATVDSPPAGTASRADQLVALDDRIGQLLAVLPDTSTVVLASLADPAAPSFGRSEPMAAVQARSQVLVAVGPAPGGGRYRQGTARAGWATVDGVAHSVDVSATVLAALGLPPPGETDAGSALAQGRATSEDPVIQRLDLDQAWRRLASVRPGLLAVGWALWLAVALGVVAAVRASRRQRQVQQRFVNAGFALGVFGAALPVAAVLAGTWPWWHGPHVTATLALALLTGAVVAGLAALAALLLPGPGRRRPTTAVLALGLVTTVAVLVDRVLGNGLAAVGVLDHGGVLAGGLALVAVALTVADRPSWAARLAGVGAQRALVGAGVLLLAGLAWWTLAGSRPAMATWTRGPAWSPSPWSSSTWPVHPWLTLASTLLVLLPALLALAVRLADEARQAAADAAADEVRRATRG